jgi:transposase
MLQITPRMKILLAVEPADFRRGIDGLAQLCRERLQQDPFLGTVFVFRNRRGTAVKLLTYDGQGFWLCHKRLSLVAGITASTILTVRATRAEAAARDAQQAEAERAEGERRANAGLAATNAELAAEQAKVEARNKELAAEQAKVQARFDMAKKAIALFHTGVSEDMLLKNPQFEALRTKLLKEAAGFYGVCMTLADRPRPPLY